ncbi:PASTA domain-containing protein [Merdimmobilis hominis]|uniref:PASTA domain-containing protein n=1 Tax=Merdimmobilis hominis TaxID=2897707 RepID=UPI0006C7D936|nr:PASTA domain-containing protein [Merdimmobilis hominis]
MSPLNPDGSCSHCSYRSGAPHRLDFLAPGEVLCDRYLVGVVRAACCDGPVYIGFDQQENIRVWIKEYMPQGLCTRNQADGSIEPKPGCEMPFKSLKSDFEDLCKGLQKMGGGEMLVPLIDLISAHKTVYGVYRLLKTVTLTEYLRQNGGELTWPDAKKIFMPLCRTVSDLHKKGYLHRGICPDNILLDDQGRPWLWGLAIAAARMKGELVPDLCPGYSAPEQYEENGWPGTFTDVYALAAVLYKMLTGTMPPEAPSRMVKDNLAPASDLNARVPESVSDAISAAMMLSPDFRMETVEELTAALLESENTNTAVFDSERIKEVAEPEPSKPAPRVGKKTMLGLMAALVAILVVALIAVARGMFPELFHFGGEPSQPEVSSSQVDTTVPKFVGQYIEAVMTNAEYQSRFELRTTSRYDSSYPAGVVVEQSTPEGAKMIHRGVIILTVSEGPQVVDMPDIVGSKLSFATKALSQQGIRYQVLEVVDDSLEPGLVSKTSILPGEPLDKSQDVVFLYTKKVEEAEDTEGTRVEGSSSAASQSE